MKKVLVTLTIALAANFALAGNLMFSEDFNGGDFVAASATRTLIYMGQNTTRQNPWGTWGDAPTPAVWALLNADENAGGLSTGTPMKYDWTGAGDYLVGGSTSGWTIHADFKWTPSDDTFYGLDRGVELPNTWWGGTPSGANHIGGNLLGDNNGDGLYDPTNDWTSTDGNIGMFQKSTNDVPKNGWSLEFDQEASTSGARDADGNILAYAIHYDAELNFLNPKGIDNYAKVNLQIGGGSTDESVRFVGASKFLRDGDVDVSVVVANPIGAVDSDDATAIGAKNQIAISSGAFADGTKQFRAVVPDRTGDGGEPINIGIGLDNLSVYALDAGDVNGDLSVNGVDAGGLIAGWGETGDKAWADGDNNGDANVNGVDAGRMISGWTGDPGPTAEGTAVAEYDVTTGEIIVSGTNVINWYVESLSGGLTGDAPSFGEAAGSKTDNDNQIGAFPFVVDSFSDVSLGAVAEPGLTDLTIWYQASLGQALQEGTVVVVPEPATMSLLAIGGLVAIRRRRRK